MQDEIVDVARDKNFEMVGVDLWNGSASQLKEFQFVTQVKFPLLQRGTNSEIPWGLGVENIIVVDPEGIVQGILSVVDRDKVIDLIDLINEPVAISEVQPKSIYWGTTGEVGVQRTVTVTIENLGLTDLVVSEIRSTTDQVLADKTELTVAPRGKEQFVVTLNPTREGTLTGSVEITTNERNWTLPITSLLIERGLSPAIVLSNESVDYGLIEMGRTLSRQIEIQNAGLGPLTVTGVETDLEGATISEQSFTLGAGKSKTITVTVQPPGEGAFVGTVWIASDDPDKGSVEVNVVGSGQVIPADARTDFDGSGTVDFADFLGFAGAFGTGAVVYDVDSSGMVDFADFLVFIENFGRSVVN